MEPHPRAVVKNTASGNLRSGSGRLVKRRVAGEGVRLGHAGTIH